MVTPPRTARTRTGPCRRSDGPVISVVVPVRNGMPCSEEQLRALAAQKCDEAWEVVIADNGSTDGSLSFARDWADAAPERPSWSTPPAGRGRRPPATPGSRWPSGDLPGVLRCRRRGPGRVARPPAWRRCSSADLAAGRFDFWSLNTIPPAPPVRAATRQLGFLPAGLGANLAVRRAPFEEVGGFDEQFVPGEDIDLCWRLQLHGFPFTEAPAAVVAKRARSDVRGVFEQAYAYGQCGPLLHKRYRKAGARRDLRGAAQGVAVAGRCPCPGSPSRPDGSSGPGRPASGSVGSRRRWAAGVLPLAVAGVVTGAVPRPSAQLISHSAPT